MRFLLNSELVFFLVCIAFHPKDAAFFPILRWAELSHLIAIEILNCLLSDTVASCERDHEGILRCVICERSNCGGMNPVTLWRI